MCVREDDVVDLFRTIDGVLPVEPSPRPLTLVEAGVDQQAGTLVLENELASGDRARGALEVEDDGHGSPSGQAAGRVFCVLRWQRPPAAVVINRRCADCPATGTKVLGVSAMVATNGLMMGNQP